MAASAIIIGGLLLGSVGLQKTLHESQAFVTRYADQRRIIDAVARDLRRAILVASKDSSGLPISVAGQSITIAEGAVLIFTVPGYYRSDAPAEPAYDDAWPVISTDTGLAYGDTSGPAPELIGWFKKVFVPEEGSVCFVRKEADHTEVIVRDAESLNLRVTFAADSTSCDIEAWFRTPGRGREQFVTTYDRVLMRNSDEAQVE